MTNTEWGEGLTGEEMRALKGIVPDDTPVMRINEWRRWETYSYWAYDTPGPYHLPSDSPVYTVRDRNAKHPDERPWIPHCGDTCPADWDGKAVLLKNGAVCWISAPCWNNSGPQWKVAGYRRLAEPATESAGESGEASAEAWPDAYQADTVTLPRMTEGEWCALFQSQGRIGLGYHLNLIKTPDPTPIEALRTAHPGKSDTDLCVMLLEQRGEG